MNLYRLDYHVGHTVEPVHDWRGDYLSRSWKQAREDAIRYSAERGADVVISRISGSGYVRPMCRISPQGKVRRPY